MFSEETVLNMFERVLHALSKRITYPFPDLMTPPTFYDFVYSLVSDYEGHEEAAREGRYYIATKGWLSSFGEMYYSITDHVVEELIAVRGATMMKLSGGLTFRFDGNRAEYGQTEELGKDAPVEPFCHKNIESEECTFDFVKSIAIGKSITSAGDFGTYIEFGLDQRFNLGLHVDGFHIFSTENPIEEHKL